MRVRNVSGRQGCLCVSDDVRQSLQTFVQPLRVDMAEVQAQVTGIGIRVGENGSPGMNATFRAACGYRAFA
jgi:hypothetical protein